MFFLFYSRVNRHTLPNGAYYDHDEFMAFLTMSNDQLLHEKETDLADLERIKEELCEKNEVSIFFLFESFDIYIYIPSFRTVFSPNYYYFLYIDDIVLRYFMTRFGDYTS